VLPEGIPKLTAKERIILEMLVDSPDMYGLEIVEASNREIGRGSVYVFLDRLEDRGLVTSELELRPANTAGNARRMYRPTGEGARAIGLLRRWDAFVSGALAGGVT
jgi:DNA-binding PadR family transcriptional regulator